MKQTFFLALLSVLAGCGYVLHESPIQYAGAPKWGKDDSFQIFVDEIPTNTFQTVCTIYAGSDVGDLPNYDACVQIAMKHASRHGGNGVIVETQSEEQKRIDEENARRLALRTGGEYVPPGGHNGRYSVIKVIYIATP